MNATHAYQTHAAAAWSAIKTIQLEGANSELLRAAIEGVIAGAFAAGGDGVRFGRIDDLAAFLAGGANPPANSYTLLVQVGP
jgi:hypothetical protein